MDQDFSNSDSLDEIVYKLRDNYMGEYFIDQFFKARVVCWRFLVHTSIEGRGLIIGNHDEVVGLIIAELLEETYVTDTDIERLFVQKLIANALELNVNPIHSEFDTLPFPPKCFDVIVVKLRGNRLDEITKLKKFLKENGSLLLLIDGWSREFGLTRRLGLGGPTERSKRFRAGVRANSHHISRVLEQSDLSVNGQYALLSTNRHDNERMFDMRCIDAINWLLEKDHKISRSRRFQLTKYLTKIIKRVGILDQCYPRYLFECSESSSGYVPKNAILLSGKNRSTLINFNGSSIQSIQKIPNSRSHSIVNEQARNVINSLGGKVSQTVPIGTFKMTRFGLVRHEEPVRGLTFDQTLQRNTTSFKHHLSMLVDWLLLLQKDGTTTWVHRNTDEIENMLTWNRLGLMDPPNVTESLTVPLVKSHGDLFGSNIYHDGQKITTVIDWEWASIKSNPIIDPGFFMLQYANLLGEDFAAGFKKLFVESSAYSEIIYDHVHLYCNQIGIDPYSFIVFLPINYIERSCLDLNYNKRLDIDWPARVRKIWEYHDVLISKFDIDV